MLPLDQVLKDDKAVSARSFHLLHQTRQEPSELSQEELLHTCHAEEVLSSYQLQIQAKDPAIALAASPI